MVGGSLAICAQLLPYQEEQMIAKAVVQTCTTVIGVTFLPHSVLSLGMLGLRFYDSCAAMGFANQNGKLTDGSKASPSTDLLLKPESNAENPSSTTTTTVGHDALFDLQKYKSSTKCKLQDVLISRHGQEKYYFQLIQVYRTHRKNLSKQYIQLVFITLYFTNILTHRLRSAPYQYKWYRYLLLCHALTQQPSQVKS